MPKPRRLTYRYPHRPHRLLAVVTEPEKKNGDNYILIPKFYGRSECALFSVIKGHGADGPACSMFCRDHVSVVVAILLLRGFPMWSLSTLPRRIASQPSLLPAPEVH